MPIFMPKGETEPRHAEKGVVFGYAQNFDHIELADDREVAMSVDDAFRQTGGARRVETETIILGFRRNRIEMRRSVVCQISQRFFSLRPWAALLSVAGSTLRGQFPEYL